MGWDRYGNDGWSTYVPVGQRLGNAKKHAAQVAKKQGRQPSPVTIHGKKIATTFWGKAWCDNLTAYSDFSNRLPRGATYVRNGSVVDLVVNPRTVTAIVAGSETYKISIKIAPLAKETWKAIKNDCSASIDSLLDLLAGRFSEGVMKRLTRPKDGLFPAPTEIQMDCSCPDWSDCCKHLAAVMYGIGARLDKQPELLFLLRDVDHQELVSQAVSKVTLEKELSAGADESLKGQDLGAMFGIELDLTPAATSTSVPAPKLKSIAPSSRRRKAATISSATTETTGIKRKPAARTKKKVASNDITSPSVPLVKSPRDRKPSAAKPKPKKTSIKKTAAVAKKTTVRSKKKS